MKIGKRGVTIAEAVVAMAVIVVVTIAASTVLRSAAETSAKDAATAEAVATARSALEGYIHYSNESDFDSFLDGLGFAGGEYDNEYVRVNVYADYTSGECRIVAVMGETVLFDTTYKAE